LFGAELCPPGPCATADADRDGTLDDYDACPKERETVNGFEEGDGCPDRAGAELAEQTKKIHFETNSDRLRRSSTGPLRVIAALASGGPDKLPLRVEVVGYADERGTDEANQALSQHRADAVLLWLVAHGVRKEHVRAVGKGELPGKTADTMRVNRRVEVRVDHAPREGAGWGEEVPELRFRSGWSITHDAVSKHLVLVSAAGLPCLAYSVVRQPNRAAIYTRCATGQETDLVLEKRAGILARALFRVRPPPPQDGSTAVASEQRWEDREAGAPPAAAVSTPATVATPTIAAVVLASGRRHPGAITVYGTTVYVAVEGAIVQIPKVGGIPKPTLIGARATSLVADGSHLYWSEGDKVMRAFKDGGGPLTVATGQTGAGDIMVHGNHLFWVNGARASRASRSGERLAVITTTESPKRMAVNDAGTFYLSSADGAVVRMAPGAAAPTILASDQDDAADIGVDASHVYWVGGSGVRRIPHVGGAVTTLSSTPGRKLVLDATHVFWIVGQPDASSGDGIARIPKAGGHQGVIASEGTTDLAVDDSRLYWTRSGAGESDGSVMAMPKR
jgi:outer membrane protein OmpA-like peptidoglycan-associated protein